MGSQLLAVAICCFQAVARILCQTIEARAGFCFAELCEWIASHVLHQARSPAYDHEEPTVPCDRCWLRGATLGSNMNKKVEEHS